MENVNADEPIAELVTAPTPVETQVGLISSSEASRVQDREITPIRSSYSFNMFQSLVNQHLTSNRLLVALAPIIRNNTFGRINHHSSFSQTLFQHHPVASRAGIDIGLPNGQFMTNQRSVSSPLLNVQIINSHREWNSMWSPQQFSFVSLMNQAMMPDVNEQEVDGSDQQPGPEQAMGIQVQQVVPTNANRVTAQRDKTTTLQSSSARAQPSETTLNMLNQNVIPIAASLGPSMVTTPQQNQNQNSLNKKGKEKLPCGDGFPLKRVIEVGECSSSKRQKTPANEGMAEQNHNATNYSSEPTPRQIVNVLYDPMLEPMGLPIDPHIRLMKALLDPKKDGHHLFV